MTASFYICKKLSHGIVRVKDAKLDYSSRLEEKYRRCDKSENSNAQLSGAQVPGGDEVEEDDWRDHEEEGDDVVGKAEASRQGESWLRAAAAAATVAAAIFVTDEAEGEGGDEGDDEDVREGEQEVEESSRSKTHERNETQCELSTGESKNQEKVSKKLMPKTNRFEGS